MSSDHPSSPKPTGVSDPLTVDEIVSRLLDLPATRQQEQLSVLCGHDDELRRQVEELLQVDSAWVAGLEDSVFHHVEHWSTEDRLGQRAGAYRLEKLLGRGGTSSVYLGQRCEGVGPDQVAVKILSTFLTGAQARLRFSREAEVLARLSHPNIASIYGGGTCEDGAPFLLLEYVAGEPLDRWCERRALSIADRARLMLPICDALRHAHGKLIIHRDLKPANILVGSNGEPKLLDFGISKLMDLKTPDQSTATAFRMLTPEYASPEQLQFQPTSVATDIYALGVVLFELLTGRHPFERQGDDHRSLFRSILEDPAPKPSRAVLESEKAHGPAKPRPRLPASDLDAVVLRALAKEPDERYRSIDELAHDLECYLGDRPVLARSPTFGYRFGKFLKRRRRELISALIVMVFVVLRWLDLETIRTERDRAEATRDFLVEVLREASPSRSRGQAISLRELLDQSVERLDRFAHDPELELFFLEFYGDIYTTLGVFEPADQLLCRARQLAEDGGGKGLAGTLTTLSFLKRSQGFPRQAEDAARRALSLKHQIEDDAELKFSALQNLGLALVDQGRFSEAKETLRQGLEMGWSESLGLADQALAFNNMGYCLFGLERFHEALFYFRRSAELRRRSIGVEHPDYGSTLNNIGAAAMITGQPEMAREAFEEALMIWQARDPDNPTVAILQNNLAMVMGELGDQEGAVQRFQAALEHHQRTVGPDHPDTAVAHNNIANLLTDLGRFNEALAHHWQALSILESERGLHHPETLAALWNLLETEIYADLPRGQGVMLAGMAELEARLRAAANDRETVPDSIVRGVNVLARLYDALGRPKLGEALKLQYSQRTSEEKSPS